MRGNMNSSSDTCGDRGRAATSGPLPRSLPLLATLGPALLASGTLWAAPVGSGLTQAGTGVENAGGEAALRLPDLGVVTFWGMNGRSLLMWGLLVCVLGAAFGYWQFLRVKRMPVHRSMREISELIYETCKIYLLQQGKFLLILELFIGVIILFYFGFLQRMEAQRVLIILAFSVLGITGSYSVAWFGIRVNTFANSRTAFGSLTGDPMPVHTIPISAGMAVGLMLVCVELFAMLCILLFVPGDYAGPCFIGFAIGESLGAAALRIAGGIFTKIADIGADLMKIVFNIKEDDARNPGVIADCAGDNAGDSVGPTADGFETYGVTGVALIAFILVAVHDPKVQVQLLVWIFVMRVMMIFTSAFSYLVNAKFARLRYAGRQSFNYESPLTSLVWLTSIVSVAVTYVVSWLVVPSLAGDTTLWWKLSTVITCGTLAGAVIPEVVKVFTSTEARHVREVVTSSREGGASLNILSGLVAGDFSAFWLGAVLIVLMGIAFIVSTAGLGALMVAPPVFAFGLVAFGFLGMGPVTIAVDSYGPVTDNAQSVFELSLIEQIPGIEEEIRRDFGFDVQFRKAKEQLEQGDGAGNTFKATAKPVLIGTAVVGATTMIFSIVVVLTMGLTENLEKLSILHPPFLLGLIAGGAIIYWFTGASTQAVTTGAYRAVEFIKRNIRLEGVTRASVEDSKRVVGICTQYAQRGMFNIFLAVFFATLAFAFLEPYFFIGYLISIAMFGLYQAIFMANAGGAWDNAKKVVEVELKEKGTPLHAATVVGDTVGDPFKDTSSVAMNPIIKFTTLFGLLAVELAVSLNVQKGALLTGAFSALFLAVAIFFIYRSFYSMRIPLAEPPESRRGVGTGGAARSLVGE
jgi:K(+)-stimulated pyrophosphate-energized sodium pump